MKYVRPKSLPRFKKPPVSEVRIGIVLQPVHLSVTHLPALFEALAEDYPLRSELPLRPPELVTERLRRSAFRLELGDTPPLPRIRFTDEGQTRWIDVQSDSLTFGWRRSPKGEYPNYKHLRGEFDRIARLFEAFWDKHEEKDDLYIVQAGIHYYNDFPVANVASSSDAMCRAFAVQHADRPFGGLPAPTASGLSFTFDFSADDETYAVLAARADVRVVAGRTVARLNLGYRGDPFMAPVAKAEGPLDVVLGFLDNGHDRIVLAFTGMTSEEFHSEWERYQ